APLRNRLVAREVPDRDDVDRGEGEASDRVPPDRSARDSPYDTAQDAPLPPLLEPPFGTSAAAALDPAGPVTAEPHARPVLDEAVDDRRDRESEERGQHCGERDDDRTDRRVVEEADHGHDRAGNRPVQDALEAVARECPGSRGHREPETLSRSRTSTCSTQNLNGFPLSCTSAQAGAINRDSACRRI